MTDSQATLDAVTRARLVWVVLFLGAAFLLGAAGRGFYNNDFSGLQGVWTVVGPVYGGIAAYFFTKS